MSEGGDSVESAILVVLKSNQDIMRDDVTNIKRLKMKSSSDLIGKLLEDGKLEKEVGGSFQAAGGALKDIENQGLLEDLEALDKVVCDLDASELASSSKSSPQPIYQKKRGRPRKGTYVPRSSNAELSAFTSNSKFTNYSVRQEMKRKCDAIKLEDSTDAEYNSGVEQTSSRGKSKRRRQPKVLDDYVTDFDTSDEEVEKFSRSAEFQLSKPKNGFGRGRSKKPSALHPLENDDILSYYLGNFDRNFAEQDVFCEEFLGEVNESNEEEEDTEMHSNKHSLVSDVMSDNKVSRMMCARNDMQVEDNDFEDDTITSSRQKDREWKHSTRNPHQQLAALQQRYCQLLQKLQKKPQVNKVVDLVHGASKLLTEEQLVFFTLQLKSNSKNLQGIRFSAREKVLALAIYAHSPETYKWLQSVFYLPTKLILDRWLEVIAKNNPDTAKRLIYYIFNKYIFRS